MSAKQCEKIEELLKSLKLPTSIPDKIDRDPILKALKKDKKNRNQGFTFTLLKKIGRPLIVDGITADDVRAVL